MTDPLRFSTLFSYSYYYANQDTLFAAPIQNGSGSYITPNTKTVGDGSYEPLARRIYMNLNIEEKSLEATVPFVRFGMSDEGEKLVSATGYVPIPSQMSVDNVERVSTALEGDSSDGGGLGTGAIIGIIVAVVAVIAGVLYFATAGKQDQREIDTAGGASNKPNGLDGTDGTGDQNPDSFA